MGHNYLKPNLVLEKQTCNYLQKSVDIFDCFGHMKSSENFPDKTGIC